ncbi:TIGR03618 family F420-dependent PPOX class oxidoreductase [Couchioplanes caeruleus]|uniref:Pyridoxamine 5'-phosphate oxidase n=2 Tax=Couchioplanes caeruleus TaxID=56438 RepID=A0A1K0GSY3_9ACTN|nr:TIGR03618 family F420-dependent PPOX class oxidoreductase [Couchioplanes caeruleus]OJF14324.1 pyridoxamine 5'-phosphate oxidase [Couchioplanes caeruleus subsp. caeruleus]ROP32869.1 PPOX class probable F420-dependent enzyme [Couchioplanes caeruleus]
MSDDDLWAAVVAADLCTLATIRKDGRPQLSDVNYTADPATRVLRISTRGSLAKVLNLRRDPRATLRVGPPSGGYVAADVTASFSPPSADEHDATVEELIEVYRLIARKEHPDWDDYRRAMVADGRIVLRLAVERLYGWTMP